MAERNYEDECGDHGGSNSSGEPCGRPAGWGTEFDSGKCRHHRGTSPDGSSHVNNGNAERHGLQADRGKWFARHREDVAETVRLLTASYLEDAPFGWSDTAKVHQLVEVVIDQVRLQESNAYLDEFLKEQVVATTETGAPIRELKENPAHLPRARIKRDNIRILKDLGILDDPDSQQADAVGSLAEVLSDE